MSGSFRDEVASLPGQFAWAPAPEGALPPGGRLLIGGLGGSALAGEFLARRLGGEREVLVVRDAGLPPGVREDDVLLAMSYSGTTMETRALWEEAGGRGLPRGAVTSGGPLLEAAAGDTRPHVRIPKGLAPRSALGYLLRGGWSLVGGKAEPRWEGIAAHLREVVARWVGPAGAGAPADELASRLEGSLPAFLVSGPLWVTVARRWSADLAENAKAPSMIWSLPEAAHNSVMAVAREAPATPAVSVFALGGPEGGGERLRWEATLEVLAAHGASITSVDTGHEDPWIRALGLAHLGDWVSLALAERRGVDPASLSLMDDLKALISGKEDA